MKTEFYPFKFPSQAELFSRPDESLLNLLEPPYEDPMGTLTVSNGLSANVEFLFDHEGLGRKNFLGQHYRGHGIYLLSNYDPQVDEEIPFWVILKKGSNLTVGQTKTILNRIERILISGEHETNSFWTLDGEKPTRQKQTFRNAVHTRIFPVRQYTPMNLNYALGEDFRAHWREN